MKKLLLVSLGLTLALPNTKVIGSSWLGDVDHSGISFESANEYRGTDTFDKLEKISEIDVGTSIVAIESIYKGYLISYSTYDYFLYVFKDRELLTKVVTKGDEDPIKAIFKNGEVKVMFPSKEIVLIKQTDE